MRFLVQLLFCSSWASGSPAIVPLGRLLVSRKLLLPVLFDPGDRVEEIAHQDTHVSGEELPQRHQHPQPRQNKLDELIGLIQIVLAGDVVFASAILDILLCTLGCGAGQMQYSDQTDFASVGGNCPDGKDLGEADVKDHVLLVKGDGGDVGGYLGRHDLVPAVDAGDQVAGVGKGAGAAERMCELSIFSKVLVDGSLLKSGWCFGEEGDDVRNLADWTFQC